MASPRQSLVRKREVPIIDATLAAARTSSDIGVDGANQVEFFVEYTHNAAVSTLTFTLFQDPFDDGTDFQLQEEGTPSSGAIALDDLSYTKAVSGDKDFSFTRPITGSGKLYVVCTPDATNASASVIVRAVLSVQ